MLRPAMTQIIKKDESYYAFTVAVAKRAREIVNDSEEQHNVLEKKPVQLAVEEFATGKYKSLRTKGAEE